MIPMLLWQCPLCSVVEALVEERRLFRSPVVRCSACETEWRVRRSPGDGCYLRLVRGAGEPPERPLADWYDVVRDGARLRPIVDAGMQCDPGESLYLASRRAELQVEDDDPLFFPGAVPTSARADKRTVGAASQGEGRLFLSDRRLRWLGRADVAWPLEQLRSAYALMDFGLALLVRQRLYTVFLPEESVLKWVTYLGLVANQVSARTGRRITVSHW